MTKSQAKIVLNILLYSFFVVAIISGIGATVAYIDASNSNYYNSISIADILAVLISLWLIVLSVMIFVWNFINKSQFVWSIVTIGTFLFVLISSVIVQFASNGELFYLLSFTVIHALLLIISVKLKNLKNDK